MTTRRMTPEEIAAQEERMRILREKNRRGTIRWAVTFAVLLVLAALFGFYVHVR